MNSKINIGILISGRGSNMAALIRACATPDYPARIVTVVSNRADAPGLLTAAQAGIPTATLPHLNFPNADAFEDAIHNHLIKNDVQLICLAGFMRLLSAAFVKNWTERILNIHPSLLPEYPGLHPQARALADGQHETGCTVHIVTAAMDAGPILTQRHVAILPEDTEESLSARILAQEHLAYPEAVALYARKLLNPTTALGTTFPPRKESPMDTHHISVNTYVDPKELDRAHAMWADFTRFTKYGIITVVALLILMAIFLV